MSKIINTEAKQFKTFRKSIGISQIDLAAELDCSQSEISKYEKGEYQIPIKAVKHLHIKYKMSYHWYFHREGHMKDNEQIKPTIVTDIASLKEDNKYLVEKVKKLEKDLIFLSSRINIH